MADFNIAVSCTLAWEGGHVNDVLDPGGETNFGISKRAYPLLDIANLTREQAVAIYHRDYWEALYGELESQEVADELFDFGVNVGRNRAINIFQQAVKYLCAGPLVMNGCFGRATLDAANGLHEADLLREFRAREAYYYADIVISQPDATEPNKKRFLLGWLRRVMG